MKVSILSILFLIAAGNAVAGDISVKAKAEYRCEVEYQSFPNVVDPVTKGNFWKGDLTFLEFEKAVNVNGVPVYGVGLEDISLRTSRFVIFKKEETGVETKFVYGMLMATETQFAPTTNIPEAIKNFDGKQRIGFLVVNKSNPAKSAFQRALLNPDINMTYLKTLGANCQLKSTQSDVELFQSDLGLFPRPWGVVEAKPSTVESPQQVPAALQAQVNAVEARRRSAPDFKCSIPEIPGHTLGENQACAGRSDYTLQRAGK